MIKKNTKLILGSKIVEDKGGIPLSKGEIVFIENKTWEVIEKRVNCRFEGDDLTAEIIYKLKEK